MRLVAHRTTSKWAIIPAAWCSRMWQWNIQLPGRSSGTPEALDLVARALDRRFGADYRVWTAATPDEALELLARLAREGGR